MIKSVSVATVVLACISHVQAEGCFISSAPSMDRIADSAGVLRDNKKGRMLPIIVNDEGRTSALQVEFVSLPPPYDLWNGAKMFARAPIEICETSTITTGPCSVATYTTAKLECTDTPFTTDWNALDVVNVWHEGIVPGGTYKVRVMDAACNPALPASFSEPTEMQAAIFGDTVNFAGNQFPVDDAVGVNDALAGIATFSNSSGRPSKSRTKLDFRCIDHKASIGDVLKSLSGFAGGKHPDLPSTADPCDSFCSDARDP